ncbi:hypothetical protein [Oryzobacter telluris]|uniref:hypothetical protein n=1 Tax=Oryzobacter telluris TaxID=3149179 RepID=UPI00370D5AA0
MDPVRPPTGPGEDDDDTGSSFAWLVVGVAMTLFAPIVLSLWAYRRFELDLPEWAGFFVLLAAFAVCSAALSALLRLAGLVRRLVRRGGRRPSGEDGGDGWSQADAPGPAGIAQVTQVRRRPLDPAVVDVALVIPAGSSGVVLRRFTCTADVLVEQAPTLFQLGSCTGVDPSAPGRMPDLLYDTEEEAREAASRGPSPADPDEWVEAPGFQAWVQDPEFILDEMAPAERRVPALGKVVVGLVAVTTGAAAAVVVMLVLDAVGLGEEGDLFVEAIAITSIIAAVPVAGRAAEVISRRHLRTALARRPRSGAGAPGQEDGLGPDPTLEPAVDTDGPASAPDDLVIRPVSRLWFCGGLLTGAVGAVVGTELLGAEARPFGYPVAVVLGVLGVLCLRLGLTAGRDGVRVGTYFGSTTVRWAHLAAVDFEKVPTEVEIWPNHWLVLVTRRGRRVKVEGVTGTVDRGGRLDVLRGTLLAMRNRYLAEDRADR